MGEMCADLLTNEKC